MTEWDLKCMRLAIQVAKIFPDTVRGKAVGAVLASKDEVFSIGYRDTTIGATGIHNCIHAEDSAIYCCRDTMADLTLYVTYEPCRQRLKHSTWIERKSCVEQILAFEIIKRVVIGVVDSKFGGARDLRNAGLMVDFVTDTETIMECHDLANQSIIPPGQEENLRQAEENARLGGSH